MTSKAAVEEFLAEPALAVVGASRGGKKFGNSILRALRANGYRVVPVHPEAPEIDGLKCAPSLSSLPERVGGVVLAVQPAVTEWVVHEARDAGIRKIWMQQGAESPAAVRFCEENGISVVQKECILMFLREGPRFHRFHRFLRGLFGRLPR